MDKEFGSLLEKLDKYKQTEKSVVVFLSEQGNSFPFAKWTCYNAGVHSACIVRWPGSIKPGVASDAIVEYVDIVPTFLEIAGANHTNELDGKSFVPVLSGKKNQHKQYTFSLQTTRGVFRPNASYGIRSVADKKYRYIINLTPEATFESFASERPLFEQWRELAVSDSFANWITYRYQNRPAIELYDIEKDMYCMNDIAGNPENRAVIERMHKALMSWMELCGDKGQATEMEALEHLATPQESEE
jgi:uncharacterized sulfatase